MDLRVGCDLLRMDLNGSSHSMGLHWKDCLEVYNLAWRIGLEIGLIVGKLCAFAEADVAVWRSVRWNTL